MSDFPLLEDQFIDRFEAELGFPWRTDVDAGTVPAGQVVCRDVPAADDREAGTELEVTVTAATRTGAWQLARRVDRVLRDTAFLARSYVDEIAVVFGWAIEDPSPTGAVSATATFQATARRQPEPKIDEV